MLVAEAGCLAVAKRIRKGWTAVISDAAHHGEVKDAQIEAATAGQLDQQQPGRRQRLIDALLS